MITAKKIERLKRNSEMIIEFIETIEYLQERLVSAEKDKQYYMEEYKKTSDKLHELRSDMLKNGCSACRENQPASVV